MTHYDLLILGAVSKDIIVTPEGVEHSIGGAVVYSSVAAKHLGAKLLAVTKLHPDDRQALDVFERYGMPHMFRNSAHTTSIQNTYHTAEEACRLAAAVTSLKMECPGPFTGSIEGRTM